jgi:DNA-binding NtrC family response regulator
MTTTQPREILIVDDEAGIRELLSEILVDEGYRVVLAENAREARTYRQCQEPALVLLDIWMPDTDGVTLLREWASAELLTMPVIMMSGHATIETAIGATRIGAFDFLEKPIGLQKLLSSIKRALKAAAARTPRHISLARLGASEPIKILENTLNRLAGTRKSLLILGEPGAGHEIVAQALQNAQAPWVPIVPVRLTTAPLQLLEEAREGILYCPEIGQLSRLEQKGLLFLLPKLVKYETLLVCTSSEALGNLAAENKFDPMLLSQLSAGVLMLPPLRDHRDDIPLLIERLWAEMRERHAANGSLLSALSPAVLTALSEAYWPGNFDHLTSVLENLALTQSEVTPELIRRVLGENQQQPKGVSPEVTARFFDMQLREAREAFERVYFERLLSHEQHNMSRVAELAGLERTHLYRKLKQLNIRFSRRNAELY